MRPRLASCAVLLGSERVIASANYRLSIAIAFPRGPDLGIPPLRLLAVVVEEMRFMI